MGVGRDRVALLVHTPRLTVGETRLTDYQGVTIKLCRTIISLDNLDKRCMQDLVTTLSLPLKPSLRAVLEEGCRWDHGGTK